MVIFPLEGNVIRVTFDHPLSGAEIAALTTLPGSFQVDSGAGFVASTTATLFAADTIEYDSPGAATAFDTWRYQPAFDGQLPPLTGTILA